MVYIRCMCGIHNYVIDDEAIVDVENWSRFRDGVRIPHSDYKRLVKIAIQKCSRCNKKIAFKYYENDDKLTYLSVEFAEAKIAKKRNMENAKNEEDIDKV